MSRKSWADQLHLGKIRPVTGGVAGQQDQSFRLSMGTYEKVGRGLGGRRISGKPQTPARREPAENGKSKRVLEEAKLKSRLEIRNSNANFTSMTAELLLEKNIRFDRSGKPLEVIIPYKEFIEFFEVNGYDLSEADKVELREAIADSNAGNRDAFVCFEDIQKEFGCTP